MGRILLGGILLLLVACGSEELTTTSKVASTTSSTAIAPTTTAPSTTTKSATTSVESTDAPATPETSSTTYPAQNAEATDNPAGWNRAGGYAVAVDDRMDSVVAIDLATGAVDRELARLDREARHFGRIQLDWSGSAIYYDVLIEDYWFSCESSRGSIMRLDLTSGEESLIGHGATPRVSPDGSRLAYLTSTSCVPDSQDPANFVITPYDSVVVRDLATGEEAAWVDDELRAAISSDGEGDLLEAQFGGLTWLSADEVGVGNIRLAVPSMESIGTGANLRAEVGGSHTILGFDEAMGQVIVEQEFHLERERRAQLAGLDPVEGSWTSYGISESPWPVFAYDAEYRNLAVLDGGRLTIDGTSVPIDAEFTNLDW